METTASKTCAVLIVAGGNGSRMASDLPKQYRTLGGKTILRRTLETFLSIREIAQVRVVIREGHEELYERSVKGLNLDPPVRGGETRQESVFRGLQSLKLTPEDLVLVHDAARPFVEPASMRALLSALENRRAATLALPMSETAVYGEGEACIDGRPDRAIEREGAWTLQTPQGFRYGDILRAHEDAARSGKSDFTDDTALVRRSGIAVQLVKGSRSNIKITTEEDMDLARRLTESSACTRVGTGFDVHAFASRAASCVRLCGVEIPHGRALEGHSDADAGLHALTDALLGAIGENDIGYHFPPSDPRWKGADSRLFLEKAAELMRARGGRLANADVTIICESPKIGPFRDRMRERVAAILGVDAGLVNVKATTTEGLGFTGRGEGIAAQAIVAIEMPGL